MANRLQEIKDLHEGKVGFGIISKSDVAWLIAEVEKLRGALRFYADKAQWLDSQGYPLTPELQIDKDSGKRAREALGVE